MNESDPLIRRLADSNPVPQRDVDGLHRSSAERLLVEVTSGRRRRGSAAGRYPGARLLVAAGVVFAVIVGVVIVRVGKGEQATAAELLNRTAVVADDRGASDRQGPLVYAKTVSDQLTTSTGGGGTWSVVQRVVEETWIAADGSGRVRSTFGEPRFPGPRDEAGWRASGAPDFPSGVSDSTLPAGALSYVDLASLPTDPDELLSALREQVASEGIPGDVGVFLRIGQLLSRGDAPPQLRSGLYRAAARLSAVELVGPLTDPTGRAGVGVGVTYEETGTAVRAVMIFDEETSELLAQEQILLEPAPWVDLNAGARLSFIAYVGSGRVGSVEATPTFAAP